jgi:hypothetical protein
MHGNASLLLLAMRYVSIRKYLYLRGKLHLSAPLFVCRCSGKTWATCVRSRGSTLLRERVAAVPYVLYDNLLRLLYGDLSVGKET